MKKRLYFAGVANRYARQVFLPYACGLMWAYARKFPEVEAVYDLCGMLYLKEPVADAVARLDRPDVLALSSYIWNHQWNKAFARAVKERWPGCVVLVGGVQVPEESPRILEENPEFDFGIYGEGEGAFKDFLVEHAQPPCDMGGLDEGPNYAKVGSLVWRHRGKVRANPRRAVVSLEEIPSPYLEGLFDGIVTESWDFQALQETNRGCPFSCTMCSWGAASQNKLRQFPSERILAEFEWFGKNKIAFLFNCDANYAILKRDAELTEAMIAVRDKYGYPKQFRSCFTKNSNDLVLDISRRLAQAGMHKATTLALQSLDEGVLGLIKRKNIRYDRLAELAAKYEAEGIPTFTEIMIGLPNETWSTFVDGLDKVLDAHIHDGISIYLTVLLENTEMNTLAYIAEHGIEYAPMRALLYHATPEPDVVEEIQNTVVATKTMPREVLRRVVLYGWVIQALHSFGMAQHMARELRKRGVRYQDFYVPLLDWFLSHPDTVGGREVARVAALWDGAVRGESWNAVDARFGDVSWPPEEFLLLHCACDSGRFYDELRVFAQRWTGGWQLVDEQREIFIPPVVGQEEIWAREACWFGRKGQGAKLRLRNAGGRT